MLTFKLFEDDGYRDTEVTLNPAHIASVKTTEMRRAYGGYQWVAVIRMNDGKEYIVSDPLRKVVGQVIDAEMKG